jgi:hypothetical protein
MRFGSRCQPSLRMASACSWQRCLGRILHGTAAAPQSHSQHMGTALQVELTTCRLGGACDSCTTSSRSAADSGRAASATSGFIGSTVRAPSSEERISRAGPASGNRAQMLLQRSVAACVAGRLCSESLKCPAQLKRGQFVQSVSSPRPVATANLHRSGNHWLSCSIANKLGGGSLSGSRMRLESEGGGCGARPVCEYQY